MSNPDDLPPDEASERPGFVPELVRRMAAAQLKLPKDVLSHLFAQAERTKTDVQRLAVDELRRFLHSDRLWSEFWKVVSGMTIEVEAKVRLVPDRKGKAAKRGRPSIQVKNVSARLRPGSSRTDAGKP